MVYLFYMIEKILKKDIDKIIDNQVCLTSKFGLKIRKEDINKERVIVHELFTKYEGELNWNNYESIQRIITNELLKRMNNELRYYFNNTPQGETKSRYNIHLQYIINNIFRQFVTI